LRRMGIRNRDLMPSRRSAYRTLFRKTFFLLLLFASLLLHHPTKARIHSRTFLLFFFFKSHLIFFKNLLSCYLSRKTASMPSCLHGALWAQQAMILPGKDDENDAPSMLADDTIEWHAFFLWLTMTVCRMPRYHLEARLWCQQGCPLPFLVGFTAALHPEAVWRGKIPSMSARVSLVNAGGNFRANMVFVCFFFSKEKKSFLWFFFVKCHQKPDEDYRGVVGVILFNHSDDPFHGMG
jgi:hypothetical protein